MGFFGGKLPLGKAEFGRTGRDLKAGSSPLKIAISI
jgi:hypothetical protein